MLALPRHSRAFRIRRALNWFPLGLAYAFMHMGRYNLTVAKNALGDCLTKAEFGQIFGLGTLVYGLAFVVNGPLADRIGGRKTMLIGMLGSLLMNLLMGLTLYSAPRWHLEIPIASMFLVLYAINMYFQSFGAVGIVTVKAPWFHVRERGTLSTIFGMMISMGVYFAFDWGSAIVAATRGKLAPQLGYMSRAVRLLTGAGGSGADENWWIFFLPAMLLGIFWVVLFIFLRNTPADAGFENFNTGEESISEHGEVLPAREIFFKLFRHPVLAVICCIAVCLGVLKNGTMNWYPIFAKETNINETFFIARNWGFMLLIAGVIGSVLTGWISDRFFQSRRAPMTAILCALVLVVSIVMCFTMTTSPWLLGISTMLIAMSVLGIQGILSATSTIDFGGSKNAGAAVGMVDGLFYAGMSLQSFASGYLTPIGAAAKHAQNWIAWPALLVPFAIAGFYFSLRIWSALPAASRATTIREPQPPAEAPRNGNRFPGAGLDGAGHGKKTPLPVATRLAS